MSHDTLIIKFYFKLTTKTKLNNHNIFHKMEGLGFIMYQEFGTICGSVITANSPSEHPVTKNLAFRDGHTLLTKALFATGDLISWSRNGMALKITSPA